MNIDSLEESKSEVTALDRIKEFTLRPESFIGLVFVVMIALSLLYLGETYSSCDGRVVRGFIGLECIDGK